MSNTGATRRLIRTLLAAIGIAALFGCSETRKQILIENRLPEVRMTAAPIDSAGRYYYSITLNWVGFDPDGRVDHYIFTQDPHRLSAGQDTVWERTEDNEVRMTFPSTRPVREPGGRLVGVDYHTFLIRAVDDRGAAGPYAVRAFSSFTVAPIVRLVSPRASDFPTIVTPAVRISWEGEDSDGVFTTKPLKYKYILLSNSSEFKKDLAFQKPDSLRRYYENHPDGPWAGWDSTSAETTQVQFTNLTPTVEYVFAVIGFDEAGAYSPFFTFSNNMTIFRVGFAGKGGPVLTMFNEFFNYTYSGGGYNLAEKATIGVEVPANRRITINWFAVPPEGADIEAYRWSLDNQDVFASTERPNELDPRDFRFWSTPSASATSATVGPFGGGEIHFFYIDVVDNNGLKSLGIIRFEVVEPTFERPLLIVDDTRLQVDVRQQRDTCIQTPTGPWPTRAEMDTFLFARGNVRWRCYPRLNGEFPRTQPGLFAGYPFDTFGTRIGRDVLTVKLSRLGHYEHVIWMTDGLGATYRPEGTDLINPQTALFYMGGRGRVNTLATYIRQGGKVWLNGGGGAHAVSDGFNDVSNDRPSKTWSIESTRGELVPGRFMFDIAHWQAQFRVVQTTATISRARGRFEGTSTYAGLPQQLTAKSQSTDPYEVEAPARNASYAPTSVHIEWLEIIPNYIIEDLDPDPDLVHQESTLDTLYRVTAPILIDRPEEGRDPARTPRYPIMTYYHGPPPDNTSFIFSGFPIWWPKRTQAQQFVDYVMTQIWDFQKGPTTMPMSYSAAPPQAVRPAAAAPPRVPGRAPVGANRRVGSDPRD